MRKLIESTLVSLDGVIDLFEDVDTSSLHLALADIRRLPNNSAVLTYLPS